MVYNFCSKVFKDEYVIKSWNGGVTMFLVVKDNDYKIGDHIVLRYKGLINVYIIENIDKATNMEVVRLFLRISYPNQKPLLFRIKRFFKNLIKSIKIKKRNEPHFE